MARAAAPLALLLALLAARGSAQLLGDGGHHSLESDECTMATFSDRTAEVDGICCDQANSIADACLNGVPQHCDSACAGVFMPSYPRGLSLNEPNLLTNARLKAAGYGILSRTMR
jgi:hypothetical protein